MNDIIDRINEGLKEDIGKYYREEFDKVGDKRVTVIFYGNKGESNMMNVNKDSIPVIIEFLKKIK